MLHLLVLTSLYMRNAIIRPMRRAATMAVRLAGGAGASDPSLEAGRDTLQGVAEEQAALRRVATLVGAGGMPEEIFGAVSDEVRQLVGIDITSMFRCEEDDRLTLLAVRSRSGPVLSSVVGRQIRLGPAFRALLERGRPQRLDAAAVASWIRDLPEARALGLRASIGVPIIVEGRPWGAIFASATTTDALPAGAEEPFAHFTELVATAIANAQARSDLRRLAEEQAALRRVATYAMSGAGADDIMHLVAEEVARVVDAELTGVHRNLPGGRTVRVASWAADGRALPIGVPRVQEPAVDGELNAGRVIRVTRVEDVPDSQIAAIARERGVRMYLAVPIMVEGRTWGAVFAGTTRLDGFECDAAERMRSFTELVAIAISAVAAREELARSNERLAESRARVVAAADEERARVVRDLHDGAQQRLVHAIITLKLARRALAADDCGRANELTAEALEQANRANVDLHELAQGIMPSVLTHGGLLAGVRSLVDELSLPVHVDVLAERLPPQVESNAYFIIAEALTNVLKHAEAHEAEVRAYRAGDTLAIEVRDDGMGGASLSGSTGLLGLHDRAVAADGSLRVDSPPGGGTHVAATLPLIGG
jgi:signal transduction histidine kinase